VLAYEHLREKASGDAFVESPKRHNNAVVAGYSGRFDALGIQADVRRDDNSAYGGNTTGRLGMSWRAMRGLKLRALAGTSFRAPTFNDLYFPDYGIPPGTPGFEVKPSAAAASRSARAGNRATRAYRSPHGATTCAT
jgi:vitamin B12 transporter